MSTFLSRILIFHLTLCDYRLKIMVNKPNDNKEHDEARRQGGHCGRNVSVDLLEAKFFNQWCGLVSLFLYGLNPTKLNCIYGSLIVWDVRKV